MKRFLLIPALLAAGPLVEAQTLEVEALLTVGESTERIYLVAASKLNIEYVKVKGSLNRNRKARAEVDAIYFFEPPQFKEALYLYESRDYEGAKAAFAKCREIYKPLHTVPGNYSTLAGFHEIECARQLGDYAGMAELLKEFQSGSLASKTHLAQLELNPLWDAVGQEDWSRAMTLAEERLDGEKTWTNGQLAQVYYCHGLALEKQGQESKALDFYNKAFTVDYAASARIARNAVIGCLRIYQNMEGVKRAIAQWGTEEENRSSDDFATLQEAVALCELWQQAPGSALALPEEYSALLKYKAE